MRQFTRKLLPGFGVREKRQKSVLFVAHDKRADGGFLVFSRSVSSTMALPIVVQPNQSKEEMAVLVRQSYRAMPAVADGRPARPGLYCFRRKLPNRTNIAVSWTKSNGRSRSRRPESMGAVPISSWRETPCTQERVATEADVRSGRAVFYLDWFEGQRSRPFPLDLPVCAVLHEEGRVDTPVVIIQAETSITTIGEQNVFVGYRPLTGGNGICGLGDLEILSQPDERFKQ